MSHITFVKSETLWGLRVRPGLLHHWKYNRRTGVQLTIVSMQYQLWCYTQPLKCPSVDQFIVGTTQCWKCKCALYCCRLIPKEDSMGPWQNRQTLITSVTSLSYIMTRCDFSWFEQNLMSQGTPSNKTRVHYLLCDHYSLMYKEWEPLVGTSKASMTYNWGLCWQSELMKAYEIKLIRDQDMVARVVYRA